MVRAQLLNNFNGLAAVSCKGSAGEVTVRILPMGYEDFIRAEQRYRQGALLQQAFANLTDCDREFLLNGTTPIRWYEMFAGCGEPDDEEQALDEARENGQYFLSIDQYQLIYAGEKTPEDIYTYNRKQIEARLADNAVAPSV